MKKAIIFDLDNTIYPVSSTTKILFPALFSLIEKSGDFIGDVEDVKSEIQRIPFQKVIEKFSFGKELSKASLDMLDKLTYNYPMQPFPDYAEVRMLSQEKHLVTSGFTRLQQSKVSQLGIRNDFISINIIDLQTSNKTKQDVFETILKDYKYNTSEVLVIGDDPESEIKAGKALGIECVLYDRNGNYPKYNSQVISRFKDLPKHL